MMKKITTQQYFLTMRIIVGAMAMGIIIFTLIASGLLIKISDTTMSESMTLMMSYLLPSLTALALYMAVFPPLFLQNATGIHRAKDLGSRLGSYRSLLILRLAILEGPALLVAVMLMEGLTVYFGLLNIALVIAMLSLFPTPQKLIDFLQLDYNDAALLNDPNAELMDMAVSSED